jgi:tetratricopeptide (TPR) repeat protein
MGAHPLFGAENVRPEVPAQRSEVARIYTGIIGKFDREARAAAGAKVSREQLRKMTEERNQQLARLIESAEQAGLDQCSAADIAVLAAAAEQLRQHERCIRLAEASIDKNAVVETAYRPLIRTFVNLNRPDDAAAALKRAEMNLDDPAALAGMHYFIYRRQHANGNASKAIEHFDAFINSLGSRLDADPGAADLIVSRLDELQAAYRSAHREADLGRFLQKLLRRATSAAERANADPIVDGTRIEAIVRVNRLCCEIALRTSPGEFDERVADWCNVLLCNASLDATKNGMRGLLAAIAYASEHSHVLADPQIFETISRNALAGAEGRTDMDGGDVLELRRFEKRFAKARHANQLLGTPMPPGLLPTDPETREKWPLSVVYVFDPFSDGGLDGLAWIDGLRKRSLDHRMSVLCVARYSGFAFDSKTRRVSKGTGISHESERGSWSDFHKRIKCDMRMHFTESDCDVPAIWVIDEAGKVRCAVAGVENLKRRYVESEIVQLLGKPSSDTD